MIPPTRLAVPTPCWPPLPSCRAMRLRQGDGRPEQQSQRPRHHDQAEVVDLFAGWEPEPLRLLSFPNLGI